MWLAIDIGGTKTLLAVFDKSGDIKERVKFPTNRDYNLFLSELKTTLAELKHKEFSLACVASPGRIDRDKGVGVSYGNLPWRDIPLRDNVADLLHCPVLLENDSKLAALYAARALGHSKYHKVLYLTISTGISSGLIIDGKIDDAIADAETGHMVLEHNGEMVTWQSFASGKAIVQRFNKQASEIEDPAVWKLISHDIAVGLIDVLANTQPDIVLFGGGVGSHFDKFGSFVTAELKRYETPMVKIPPLAVAKDAEDAVIYGCYELMKDQPHASGR